MKIRPWAIGLFIVCGFGLFTFILFLIGNRQKAFTRHIVLYADFNDLSGLAAGAKVRVSGFDAGQLKSVDLPKGPSGKFHLQLQVDSSVHNIIRTDSVTSIQTEGVVGDKFISIKKGTDSAEEARSGSTLPSKEPFDFAEMMERSSGLLNDVHGTITDVRGRVDGALDSITKIVNHVDGVVSTVTPQIQKIVSDGSQITANINKTTAELNDGKGSIGLLLRDQETRQQMKDTLTKVNSATASVNDVSARIDRTVADFQARGMVGKTDVALDNVKSMSMQWNDATRNMLAPDSVGQDGPTNLRQTFSNLNRGTRDVADDGEALKHNFLFRGFFKKRGYYSLDQLSPDEYRDFHDKRKKTASRRWLPASTFAVDPSTGKEQLLESGRQQIDAAVAGMLDALGNQTTVVEGYSSLSAPDEQYVSSDGAAIVLLAQKAH